MKLYGAIEASYYLKIFFRSFKRIFGSLCTPDGKPHVSEITSNSSFIDISDMPYTNERSANATTSGTYGFQIYSIAVSLWLATSSVYRHLKLFEKSMLFVKEAQVLAETLSVNESNISCSPSRLFGSIDKYAKSTSSSSQEKAKSAPCGRSWSLAHIQVRRLLADIALEVFSLF
jgi:hypothetical protein